jgi:hypothetical protein
VGPNPGTLGADVNFYSLCSGTNLNGIYKVDPTDGTVTFYDGSTALGTVPYTPIFYPSPGGWYFFTALNTLGTHPLTAVYNGDANFAPGTSPVVLEKILNASTTTVTSGPNPSIAGQPVTLTAKVSSGAGTPTGTVTFQFTGGATIGTATLSGGTASLSKSFPKPGTKSITAMYSGNASFAGSFSNQLQQVVNPAVVTFSGLPQQPLTKNASGNFVALVTITNTGNITVPSTQVTIAGTTLGSGALLVAPPAITNLAPGASAVVTLTFPPTSVAAGATAAPLKLSGTYSVPAIALSGNWGLSFRSVSLK